MGKTAQRKGGLFVQTFYKVCLILMIIGGINWGLVGLFQFDFVGWLLGGSSSIWSRIVFTVVGVAAVCGGEVLRDVPFETFIANLPACRKQCGDRAVLRAFHIYADNDRVAKQVAALREGDFDAFLQMVTASGDSSWEYLQNVIPAGYKEHQEVAVTIAAAKHYLGGKGAVRVHGGGFAGTVQAFVPVEMLADFKANMEKILGAGRCHVLSIRPEGGAVL